MIYIGIDIAKNKFDYCIMGSELNVLETGIIINNSNGFIEFINLIKKYSNVKIGMEATNIYHINLYNYLFENNYRPAILNSIETTLMKRSRIRKNKTDKIDSRAIAKYLIIYNNNTNSMECKEYNELKVYVNTYIKINKKITAIKNQLITDIDLLYPGLTSIIDINNNNFIELMNNIDSVKENNYKIKYMNSKKFIELQNILRISSNNNSAVKHDIKINIETLTFMNKQLNETKGIIENEYKSIDSKIGTIPGIGTVTGSIILSYIGDINRFDTVVKLRGYAGMDPEVRQSGNYNISSHISKRGSPLLRYALYIATISAIKYNPVVKRYYDYKKSNGMKGNRLIISCSNKLLNIIYAVMKYNKDFEDPEEVK